MNKAAWTYVTITFLITWSITLSAYFSYASGTTSIDELNLIYNFGALGPFLGAVLSAGIFYGRRGVATLFSGLDPRRLNRKALMISFSPVALFLLGLLLYPLFSGHWFSFEDTKRQFGLDDRISYISWILPFISYSVLEEFGWRGFLLPLLQSKHSALKATLILTCFWASWHLPFFLWRMQFSMLITIGFFFAIFIGSLIITSAYNFSGGSILAVILFHFSNNLASAFDKEFIVAVVSTGFVFLAVFLFRKYKAEDLADRERVKDIYFR